MTAPPLSREDAARVVAGLTKAQRQRLLSFGPEPRQMGIGMMQWLPGLVESDGLDHALFGPHYCLTPLGLQVRALLLERNR